MRKEWADAEDLILYGGIVDEGLNFRQASERLPGRTRGACIGRFSRKFPEVDLGNMGARFTEQEDKFLIENYDPYVFTFAQCAMKLGRSGPGCHTRYHFLIARIAEQEAEARREELRIADQGSLDTGGNPNRCAVIKAAEDGERVRCKWPAQRTVGAGNLCSGCHYEINIKQAEAAA